MKLSNEKDYSTNSTNDLTLNLKRNLKVKNNKNRGRERGVGEKEVRFPHVILHQPESPALFTNKLVMLLDNNALIYVFIFLHIKIIILNNHTSYMITH